MQKHKDTLLKKSASSLSSSILDGVMLFTTFFFFPGNDPIAEEVETEKLELLKMKLFLGDPLPPSISLDITLLGGKKLRFSILHFAAKIE